MLEIDSVLHNLRKYCADNGYELIKKQVEDAERIYRAELKEAYVKEFASKVTPGGKFSETNKKFQIDSLVTQPNS